MNIYSVLLINGGIKMPNRDGTGPRGKGPRTGRGLGNCPPLEDSTKENPDNRPLRKGAVGRGIGRGLGRNKRV